MDRKSFAACAGILLPLGALWTVGCDTTHVDHAICPPATPRLFESRGAAPLRDEVALPRTVATASLDADQPAAETQPTLAWDTEVETSEQDDAEHSEISFVPSSLADAPAGSGDLTFGQLEDLPPLDSKPNVPAELENLPPVAKPRPAARKVSPPAPKENVAPQVTAPPPAPAIIPEAPAPQVALPEAPSQIAPLPEVLPDAAPAGPPGTLLPWANRGPRTAEMIAAAKRADERVAHGFRMAERGATFSARLEFIDALQVIAQANDAQQDTRMYTQALMAGLTALKESHDFVSQNVGLAEVDFARVIAGHKTTLLKEAPASELTPTFALKRYYTYAQEQLAAAASQETAGSMALFGLAKIEASAANQEASRKIEHLAQASALYQAALMASPENFRAANELAVILTENGELARARDLLVRSVTTRPRRATLQNLAVVHARLGERQPAEIAGQQAAALPPDGESNPGPAVQWVDENTFARMTPPGDGLRAPPPNPQPAPAGAKPPASQPPVSTAKKSASDWLPWNIRR